MLEVRKTLTEILLEVTNEEIRATVIEERSKFKQKSMRLFSKLASLGQY